MASAWPNSFIQGDPIWYQDLRVLARGYRQFFPAKNQTPAERVNAMVRLIAYCGLGVYVVRQDTRYLAFAGFAIAVVTLAYALGNKTANPASYSGLIPDDVSKGSAANVTYRRPTRDNPWMNYTVGTALTDPTSGPALPYDQAKDEIHQFDNDGVYRDLNDVFETEAMNRRFYTMPTTTGSPDTTGFAEFAYGRKGKTCKESTDQCEAGFTQFKSASGKAGWGAQPDDGPAPFDGW